MSDDAPSLLPLLVAGGLAEHAVVCNGCGVLVLSNPNAMNAHRNWHRMTAAPTESQIEAARLLIKMLTKDGEPVDPELRALADMTAAPTGPEPRTDAAVGR